MNVEVMNSVYFKKDWAKRFHPSTFCGSLFQLCVVSYKVSAQPLADGAASFTEKEATSYPSLLQDTGNAVAETWHLTPETLKLYSSL